MSPEPAHTASYNSLPFGQAVHQFIRNEQQAIIGFRFVSVNEALARILGCSTTYWVEMGSEELHPYRIEQRKAEFLNLLSHLAINGPGEKIQQYDAVNQIWYSVHFYRTHADEFISIWHADPQFAHTEKGKQNDTLPQLLANKLERLERFMDSSSDSIQVSEVSGQMVYVNKEGASRLGISPKDIVRFKVADFEPIFRTPGTWEKHIADLRIGPMQLTSENFHEGLQEHIPVEVNVSLQQIHGREYVVALSRNISDRLAAQKELERHAAMLEILTRIANQYINMPLSKVKEHIQASLQELGTFVGADRAYIFDYDFQEGDCSNTYEWCGDGISPEIENLQHVPLEFIPQWVEMHQKGEAFLVEEVAWLPEELQGLREILEPQGIISLITVPMIAPDGRLLGFLGFDSVREKKIYSDRERRILEVYASMLVNINLRTETEARMNEAMQEARAASKAKSEFLANMSHEIRTPLNGVIGFVDLLRSTPLSPNQLEFVENTHISARTLLDLINDILDFSKIEAGKLELDYQPCSLLALTEEALDIVKYESARKELELLLDFDYHLPQLVETDALRLKQVLVNLLSNAIKFTQLGEVLLRVTGHCEGTDCRVLFEIHDTGIGISHEQLSKMFKAFSQADSSTSRRFGGTGLGLAISSFLVQKMGGKIQISSTVGQGSVFSFELQLQRSGDELPLVSENQVLKGKKAWLIQNHIGAVQISQNHLQRLGLDLTHYYADDLSDAQLTPAMLSNIPEVLVVDQELGLVTGMDLIGKLRKHGGEAWQTIPVIMLQPSNGELSNNKQFLALGVAFKLAKPLKIRDLENALLGVFNHKINPKAEAKNQSEQPVKQVLPSNVRPVVMLVDDVPMNLTLARWMVEKMVPGVRILEARSGEAALYLYNEGVKADLIFMDVQMPEMDGLETTRRIRAQELEKGKNERVPIIALTAGALQEERERCLKAGMDEFLTKPIHVNQLEMMVRKYLQKA
jgi:PAS domain S-box-containing protein